MADGVHVRYHPGLPRVHVLHLVSRLIEVYADRAAAEIAVGSAQGASLLSLPVYSCTERRLCISTVL